MTFIFRTIETDRRAGFSLIEALIAVGLFSIIAVMAVGSLTSIMDANRKARVQKLVTNNVYAAVEKMTRELRESEGIQSIAANSITFLYDDQFVGPVSVTYSLNTVSGVIYRNDGSGPVAVTSSLVKVDALTFTQLNQNVTSQRQGVLISVTGVAGTGAETSSFSIQTVISSRIQEFVVRDMTVYQTPALQSFGSSIPLSSFTSTSYQSSHSTEPKTGTVTTYPSGTHLTNRSEVQICPFTGGVIVDFEHGKGVRFTFSSQDIAVNDATGKALAADAVTCDYKVDTQWDWSNFPTEKYTDRVDRRIWQLYEGVSPVSGVCASWNMSTFHCTTWTREPSCPLNTTVPAGTYDIHIAMFDEHHCATWSGDVCTSWKTQTSSLQSHERAKLRLYSAASPRPITRTSAYVLETGYSIDIPSNVAGTITTLGTDVALPTITAVATFHDPNWDNNDRWQSVFAACAQFICKDPVGVGCNASGGGSGSTCPAGFVECSPGSSQCKPQDAGGITYSCCSGEAKYCGSNEGTCSGSGASAQCASTVAGTCGGSTPVACADPVNPSSTYCIPNDGTAAFGIGGAPVCCGSAGRPDRFCPTGYACSPDGQCFAGGGVGTVTGTQELNTQEF